MFPTMLPNSIQLQELRYRDGRVDNWLSLGTPNGRFSRYNPDSDTTAGDSDNRPVHVFGETSATQEDTPAAQGHAAAQDHAEVQDNAAVQDNSAVQNASAVENAPTTQDAEVRAPGDELSSLSPACRRALLSVLLLTLFLSIFDMALAPAIPVIASELNTGINTPWIGSAFFAAMAAFQLISGRLSLIIGYRCSLPLFLTLMSVGSMGCAASSNRISLFGFRALAGLGSGGVASAVTTIGTDFAALGSRGKWQCRYRIFSGEISYANTRLSCFWPCDCSV